MGSSPEECIMIAGDKTLRVTGVQHIATKNSVTLRIRIYLTDADGNDYYCDSEHLTFELHQLVVKSDGMELGIINKGVAQ